MHAHLRLIVSEPPHEHEQELEADRTSRIQPVSPLRLRLAWLRAHASLLGLWSASALLLTVSVWLLAAGP
jgi:hypothetical protein